MNPTLQTILDDIQADINSKHNPAADPLKVRAADEAAILNGIVNFMDGLSTPPESSLAPYQADGYYSDVTPDYVSYDGNIYKYINATPSTGNTPDTSPTYWELVTEGEFTHQQNTDTGTNSNSFYQGDPNSQDQEGSRPYIFRLYSGAAMAIRAYFDSSAIPSEIRRFEYTLDYTGTGSDVWVDLDTAPLEAAIAANTAFITAQNTVIALTDAATITWDMTTGHNATVTLGGNRTLSISNTARFGAIAVKQDATGSRTLALPAGDKVINGGGGVIPLTPTANAEDVLTFMLIGSVRYWNYGPKYS